MLADNYSLYYTRDSLPIKITVYGVFLLDVFQSLTVAVLGYYELCSGWGRPLKLLELNWTFSAVPFVTGLGEQPSSIFVRLHGMLTYSTTLVAAWVQGFYAWRIYKIGEWKILPALIIAIALMQFSAALSIAIGVSQLFFSATAPSGSLDD